MSDVLTEGNLALAEIIEQNILGTKIQGNIGRRGINTLDQNENELNKPPFSTTTTMNTCLR